MKRVALILFVFAALAGCKSGYRSVERVSFDQPDEWPPCQRSSIGVEVCSTTVPTPLEFTAIDEGISDTISRAFSQPNDKFTPPTLPMTWQNYRNPSEYRVLLVDTVARSVSPETLDCPLVRSFAGTAAGVTAGFQISGSGIEAVYPFMILPKITDARPECVALFRAGARHEAEHFVLANDAGAFLSFMGENDRHPIF